MSLFLGEVAQRHADEFVLMVMDQAGWHLAGDLLVPANMRLLFLPPYSPELEPAEHLWEALRQDCCANHVFADLHAVERTLTNGLRAPETAPSRTQAMTGFAWITSMLWNAIYYQSTCPSPRNGVTPRTGSRLPLSNAGALLWLRTKVAAPPSLTKLLPSTLRAWSGDERSTDSPANPIAVRFPASALC
jgi:hypothetical protein